MVNKNLNRDIFTLEAPSVEPSYCSWQQSSMMPSDLSRTWLHFQSLISRTNSWLNQPALVTTPGLWSNHKSLLLLASPHNAKSQLTICIYVGYWLAVPHRSPCLHQKWLLDLRSFFFFFFLQFTKWPIFSLVHPATQYTPFYFNSVACFFLEGLFSVLASANYFFKFNVGFEDLKRCGCERPGSRLFYFLGF